MDFIKKYGTLQSGKTKKAVQNKFFVEKHIDKLPKLFIEDCSDLKKC